jgi:preprotein translocase subunit SecB
MQMAAIQPTRFWLLDVSVHTNERYHGTQDGDIPRLRVGVEVAEPRGASRAPSFLLRLQCETVEDEQNRPLPYDISLRAAARFRFLGSAQSMESDARLRLLAFNGVAMLYGFARDSLAQYTAMGIHGPFVLPAINFTSIANEIMSSYDRTAGELRSEVPEVTAEPQSEPNASPRKGTRRTIRGAATSRPDK